MLPARSTRTPSGTRQRASRTTHSSASGAPRRASSSEIARGLSEYSRPLKLSEHDRVAQRLRAAGGVGGGAQAALLAAAALVVVEVALDEQDRVALRAHPEPERLVLDHLAQRQPVVELRRRSTPGSSGSPSRSRSSQASVRSGSSAPNDGMAPGVSRRAEPALPGGLERERVLLEPGAPGQHELVRARGAQLAGQVQRAVVGPRAPRGWWRAAGGR